MIENTFTINVETLQAGQVGPYKDSIYKYKITVINPPFNVDRIIEDFCTKALKPAANKGYNFNGSCNFPFGLNNYYSFTKNEDKSYNYNVCEPYCD
jgi:hypothetical protein